MSRHHAFVRVIRVKSASRRQAAVAKRPLLTRIIRTKHVLRSGKSRFCKAGLSSIIATLPARLAGQAWPLGRRRLAARSVLEAPAEPAGPSGIEARRPWSATVMEGFGFR